MMGINQALVKLITNYNRLHHIPKAVAKNIPEIGTWGFITGSHRINQEFWNKNFPGGIFGRVIGYEIKLKTVHLLIRTYRPSIRRCGTRHPHSITTAKYFKSL